MPMYDYQCQTCGHLWEALTRFDDHPCCASCGGDALRVWVGRTATIIPDTIIGGMVIENLSPTPQTFYSRSEYQRACELAGVVNKVRHVPPPDSDKSRHTSRWI